MEVITLLAAGAILVGLLCVAWGLSEIANAIRRDTDLYVASEQDDADWWKQ
jgi:hypothetical protein